MSLIHIWDKEDKRETERILLAEHQIYPNPSYVYFKGNAEFYFSNGPCVRTDPSMPMAFSSAALKGLKALYIGDEAVITVENLTSFNRMQMERAFLIFLSGYHNLAKQAFIKQIAGDNPEKQWHHFGDIDPDGFYIVELSLIHIYRLWVMDARGLSNHGNGFLGFAVGTMETQAFLRRQGRRPFIPNRADEILKVLNIKENRSHYAVRCQVRHPDTHVTRCTYCLLYTSVGNIQTYQL